MKVALINMGFGSPYRSTIVNFPLGLLSIATILRQNQVDCSIVDVPWLIKKQKLSKNNFRQELLDQIKNLSPEFIGFYTRCDILPIVISITKGIKKELPDTTIFLGGPGATFVAEDILKDIKSVDLIFRGESEVTISEVFRNGEFSNNLGTISGLSFRQNGNIINTPDKPLIKNLDDIPIPDFKLLEYYGKSNSFLIEAGRGCPYNCNFCSTSSFWKRKYRVKSPKRIINEIKIVNELFNVKEVQLIHDNLFVSEEFIDELIFEINKEIPFIKWQCSARVDNINYKKISQIKDSGCNGIFLGIETGSEKLQRSIGKNLDISELDIFLKRCNEVKLPIITSFIIGFPDESLNDLNDTLTLATSTTQFDCVESTQIHILSPNPGSDIMKSNNKLQLPTNFSDHTRPHTQLTQEEMLLIEKFPNIFLSFYEFKEKSKNLDVSIIGNCSQNFLRFYPKTMNLLTKKMDILNFFELTTQKCLYSDKCNSNQISTIPNNSICSILDKFLCDELKLLNRSNENLVYEQAIAKLLLKDFEERSSVTNYQLKEMYVPQFSNMVCLLKHMSIENELVVNSKKSIACIRYSENSVSSFNIPPKAASVLNLVNGERTIYEILNIVGLDYNFVKNIFIKFNDLGFFINKKDV